MSNPSAHQAARSKRLVTFLTFTNLSFLGGTEQFLLNVTKNAPRDVFELAIVQTDFTDPRGPNLPSAIKGLGTFKLSTIRSITPRMVEIDRIANQRMRRLFLALRFFIELLSSPFYSVANRLELKVPSQSDLVFLVRNDDSRYVRKRKGKPIIIGSTQVDNLDGGPFRFLGKLGRTLLRLRYRKIDGFQLLSRKLAERALVRKPYDFILPNGVDTRVFYPVPLAPVKEGNVRFLFVGRLEHYKGLTKLLDAWRAVARDGFELHIVGTGNLSNYVIRRAGRDGIMYHGALSPTEVASVMQHSDIFVFPTEGENFGIVVTEALSSGLYVLCSNMQRGIFDEFERRGMLRYLPNDPDSIALAMLESAPRIQEIRKRRTEVHEFVKASYDWGLISRNLFTKLQEILDSAEQRK